MDDDTPDEMPEAPVEIEAAADRPPEKLLEYVDRWRGYAWEWGRYDCSTFVGNRVLDLTGVDPLEAWRGKYRSERKALRLMVEAGGMLEGLRSAGGPFPEACIITYPGGEQVAGLMSEGWAWHFSPDGVAGINMAASNAVVTVID